MTTYATILALLLAQPPFFLEAPDATRLARLELVAAELAQLPQSQAVALAYQGHRESGFALYVWRGCITSEIPRGASGCDKGMARGYWQLWRNTCPHAYEYDAGTVESLHAETRCAARIWSNGLRRCQGRNEAGDIAGAFASFSGIGCQWAGGARRAQEYDATLQRFLRLRARP